MRALIALLLAILAGSLPESAQAAFVHIVANGYGRSYSVGEHQDLLGDQVLSLAPGAYLFSNGIGSFKFTVGADGRVTSRNPMAALGLRSKLILNPVILNIDPGRFDRSYFMPGMRDHLSGRQTVQTIAHLEDGIELVGEPFVTFVEEEDGRIKLTRGSSSIQAAPRFSLSFLTSILTLDPDQYRGMYVPIGGSPMLGKNQVFVIPDALDRIKAQDGSTIADFKMDRSGSISFRASRPFVSSSLGFINLNQGNEEIESGWIRPSDAGQNHPPRNPPSRPARFGSLLPFAFLLLAYSYVKALRKVRLSVLVRCLLG